MPRGWVNPVLETEALPVPEGRLRFLGQAEYQRLLQAARVSRWPMLHVLIKLAVTTGARRGDLLSLRWCDIDFDARRATVNKPTKNGSTFVLVLQDDVAFELKTMRRGAPAEHLVFCGKSPHIPRPIDTPFRRALEMARIEGAVFHTLRHTHASWLAQNGASLLAIAESMNHRTLAMTKRYSHLCLNDRERMLREAFGNAGA